MANETNDQGEWRAEDFRSQWITESEKIPNAPREAPNAERPGEYRLAIRSVEAEVDPGDDIHLEIYFIGYGEIEGPKLSFQPPPYFIEEGASTMRSAIQTAGWDTIYPFRWSSGEPRRLGESGMSALLGGLDIPKWKHPDLFFDVGEGDDLKDRDFFRVARVATELKAERAPVELTVRVSDTVPSGTHRLQFFFTYFNGNEWRVDSQSAEIVVRTWVRRNEGWTIVIGILIASAALLPALGSFIIDLTNFILGQL